MAVLPSLSRTFLKNDVYTLWIQVISTAMCSLRVKMRFRRSKSKAALQRAFRAIDGSVPVEKAPHLSPGLCQADIAETEVAQMFVVSQPPTWPWVLMYPSRKIWKLLGVFLIDLLAKVGLL